MSNEWIEWNGGECPVADGTLVDVRYRDGGQIKSIPANRLASGAGLRDASSAFWRPEGRRNDIIAYRMCQPEEVKPITDGGWIKCSDRMPDQFDPVLAWDRGLSESPVVMTWQGGDYWVMLISNDGFLMPTHWQPLPASPKGE